MLPGLLFMRVFLLLRARRWDFLRTWRQPGVILSVDYISRPHALLDPRRLGGGDGVAAYRRTTHPLGDRGGFLRRAAWSV